MATIEPEEDSLGHDHIGHPPAYCNWDKEAFNEYRARRYAEAGIQMDFAGHIAECRFLGKRALRYTWSGDLNNVIQTWMSMLRRSSHESQVAWVNWLFVEARDFVDMRWYAIEAVAKALLKHKKLSGSQVIAAIRGASAEAVAAAVERQAQVDRQAR